MYSVLNRIKILFYVVFCLVNLQSAFADSPPLTHGLSELGTPVKAPELQLKNLDDELIDLSLLKGKVVVVNFWATWCPPCRREMGSLERLYLATKDKDVKIIAVNIGEDIDTVFSFLGIIDPAPTFPIVFDQEGNSMDPWQVRGLPTTYILDKEGYIRYRAVGGREFDHPELINKLLELK